MVSAACRAAAVAPLLFGVLALGVPAGAAADSVVVTGPTALAVPVGSPSTLSGVSVDGFESAVIRVMASVTSGELSVSDSAAGVTVPFGYPALGSPGPQLVLEGAEDAVNEALAGLSWRPNAEGAADLRIDAAPAGAGYLADTGHYYSVVSPGGSVSWEAAQTAADVATFNGVPGHLATISSAAEQELVTRTTPGTAWIGASDRASESSWQWAAGPEAGTIVAEADAAWGGNEPATAADHDFAAVAGADAGDQAGRWRALAADDATVTRYLVEYEGGTPLEAGHATSVLWGLTVPGVPSGVSASVETEAATVSWQPPAGGSPVTAYIVTGTPSGSCMATAPATSCVVTGLAGGALYQFQVAALNDAGMGAWSDLSSPVSPQYATAIALQASPQWFYDVAADALPVELRAMVSVPGSASIVPAGQVTFADGISVLGTTTSVNGTAVLVTPLAPGSHQITASYAGDAGNGASTSVAVAVDVPALTPPATTAPKPPPTTAPSSPVTAPPIVSLPTTAPEETSTVAPPATSAPASVTTPSPAVSTTAPKSVTSRVPSTTTTATSLTSTMATPAPAGAETAGAETAAATASNARVYVVFDVGVGVDVSKAMFTVRGEGLQPGSAVTVTVHSAPVLLATVQASPTGALVWDGTLPGDLPDGEHTLEVLATGADGRAAGRVASFAVAGGALTRIGAVVAQSTAATDTTRPATSSPTIATAPTASTSEGSGGSSLRPLLLVLAMASSLAGLGMRWMRRKHAAKATGDDASGETAVPEGAHGHRSRHLPRRRPRSRRRPATTLGSRRR